MAVEIGEIAPDFTLVNQFGEKVTLSDFRGSKNVVLMFFPFAFTKGCTSELCDLRDRYTALVSDDSVVLSVSCDSLFTLKSFAEAEGLTHPMLSDFWPHGTVAQAYGVFIDSFGMAMRATFVIDKEGVVRWSVVHPKGELRDAEDYAPALAALS